MAGGIGLPWQERKGHSCFQKECKRKSHAQRLTFETEFCVASQTCFGKIFSIISSPRLAYQEPSLGATVLGDVRVWTRLLVAAGCAACCSGTRECGDCGFQTRFLVTHSKKFILHFHQSTHTHSHIVKTNFRGQFLALLYVVFSLLKLFIWLMLVVTHGMSSPTNGS